MDRLMKFVALTVGGWLGWWVGAQIGLMTAFIVSTIASGVALYAWIIISRRYLDL